MRPYTLAVSVRRPARVEQGSTWIELSRGALLHNLALFKSLVGGGTALLAVVKANAYGHGLEQVAPLCAEGGVAMLGVHSAQEIRTARRAAPGTAVLAMGYLTPSEVQAEVGPDVHVLLSSPTVLEALAAHARRLGRPIPVHLKVDTGTHRQGVAPEEAVPLARAIRRAGLDLVGIASHFANIEDTTDHEYAFLQLKRFREAVAGVEAEVGRLRWIHAACSAAALLFREADFTMVRIGISLYGHWPSKETYLSWLLARGRDGVRLQPVLSWRARVGQLKDVAAGEPIGYGLTYRTTRRSRIAVLPVGYHDGYPRGLSNRARVLLRGVRAPVVGRVCMDVVMADVTDVPGVKEGDVATLIGSDGTSAVSAEELAELTGTINYEILARLSPAIPRVVA